MEIQRLLASQNKIGKMEIFTVFTAFMSNSIVYFLSPTACSFSKLKDGISSFAWPATAGLM